MKLILDFKTKDKYIPKNYRSFILSFFKYTLKEYNSDIYEKYYSDKYHVKDFCFSIYLKNAIFNKDRISIDNSIGLTISILNFADAVDFYNALLKMKNTGYKIPMDNELTLMSVKIENSKSINTDTIVVKMLSPIIVRKVENRVNTYYSFSDDEFITQLKEISFTHLNRITGIEKTKIPLEFEIINGKKTVTYAFGSDITANLGVYKIHSTPEFLNYLYIIGIGSRRSEGFGMFEIIN